MVQQPDSGGPLLLYVTDPHFSGRRPRWRVGDYVDDLLTKWKEVGRIVKDRGVRRVVVGGDLTDSPMVSLELGDAIVDEMELWGVPVFVVVGNHDLFGNSYDTLHRTWLGHIFRRSKIIQPLEKIVDGDVAIWGVHYDDGIEEQLQDGEHLMESSEQLREPLYDADGNVTGDTKRAEKLIEIVHAMVIPGGMHPDARQVKPEDVKTLAHLVLSGDYHPGWPEVFNRVDGTKFVNPGALTRRTVSKSDYDRSIRIALVDDELEVEFVELSAKPAEEVFDLDVAKAAKEHERELECYMGELAETEAERGDVRDRIEEIAKQDGIEKVVKTTALDRYDQLAGVV